MTRVILSQSSEDAMKTILEKYDRDALLLCNKNVKASWAVATDVLNSSLVETQVSWRKCVHVMLQYDSNYVDIMYSPWCQTLPT